MKRLACEVCGSTELLKEEGIFVCQYCGVKYSVEEVKKMMIEGTVEVQGTVSIDRSKDIESIMRRISMQLEDRDFDAAYENCNKVLESEPENGEVYLLKLMAEAEVEKESDFSTYINPLPLLPSYSRALKYLEGQRAADLKRYTEQSRDYALYIAKEHFNNRNFFAAIEICETLLEAFPNFAEASNLRSNAQRLNMFTLRFYRQARFYSAALKAKIFVDGQLIDKLRNGGCVDINVPAGVHNIEVSYSMYGSISNTINVRSNMTFEVTAVDSTGSFYLYQQ